MTQRKRYHITGKEPTYTRYNAVNGRACVSEAVLPGGKLAEVARGAGTPVVEEPEDDAACGLVGDGDAELERRTTKGGQGA